MAKNIGNYFCFLVFLLAVGNSATAINISAEVDGNTASISKEVIDTSPFRVTFRPIDFEILDPNLGKIYYNNAEFLQAIYPVSEDEFESGLFPFPHISKPGEIIPVLGLPVLLNNLYIEELLRGNLTHRLIGIINKSQLQYITQQPSALGVSLYPLNFTTVLISSDYNSHAAHEIGHTLGFCDEYSLSDWNRENSFYPSGCANPFPEDNTNIKGFWVSKRKPIETKPKQYFYFDSCSEVKQNIKILERNFEFEVCSENCVEPQGPFEAVCSSTFYNFMGSAYPPWIDASSYNYLLSVFAQSNYFSLAASSFGKPIVASFSNPMQSILLSGLADRNGWVGLQDFYVIDREPPEEEISAGDYSLKLLDANENVLSDQNFGVSFTLLSDPPIDLNTTGFVLTVPFIDGTKKIRIDFNGSTRAERLVSANAPTVSIVSPSGGEEWSGTHTVVWNASDADGGELSFVLQYSSDNGVTWNPIAIDLNGESFELNAGYLEPTGNYKLKVIATDGVLTGEAVSSAFTVRNPDIDVQPWKIDFGEVERGMIVSRDLNLLNTGNSGLQVYGLSTPASIKVSGLSLPLMLAPGQSKKLHVDFNTAGLGGNVDENIVFFSNDPNEAEKHLFIGGSVSIPEAMDGNLHLSDMDSCLKEQGHYSGAAAAKMILDYIRGAAGYPVLSQDKIYYYGHRYNRAENSGLLEMDANAMDAALGHFDPYDHIITEPYNSYDSKADGNPFQGYNYTIDTYGPATDPNAASKYMRDIAHWMAYPVTRKVWWADNELVAKPNTPAAVPLFGSYERWAVVNGFAASGNPAPNPKTNPWFTPQVTIYGFWLTDPATNGIGQHVYVTADDANAIYFKPLATGDSYDGKYLQVAEPPALPPEEILQNIDLENNTGVEIAEPAPDYANLEFIGAESPENGFGEEPMRMARSMAISDTLGSFGAAPQITEKKGWRELVDPRLLSDQEAVAAFDGATMGEPLFVQDMEGKRDYYIVPFEKQGFTTGVIMLDAGDGHFRQASWAAEPVKYPAIGEESAAALVKREINPKPTPTLAVEFSDFGEASAGLAWKRQGYSQNPFSPYWEIGIEDGEWVVTQDGGIFEISKISSDKSGTNVAEIPETPPESGGFTALGRYYEIANNNLNNGDFNATLTFSYDDADGDGTVDGTGIKEEELEVYYYDEEKGWIAAQDPKRDLEANKISITVNHFTLFALMKENPQTQPEPEQAVESSGGQGSTGGGSPLKPKMSAAENRAEQPADIAEGAEKNREPNGSRPIVDAGEKKEDPGKASGGAPQGPPAGLVILSSSREIAMLLAGLSLIVALAYGIARRERGKKK